jgi:hypothetical protein
VLQVYYNNNTQQQQGFGRHVCYLGPYMANQIFNDFKRSISWFVGVTAGCAAVSPVGAASLDLFVVL